MNIDWSPLGSYFVTFHMQGLLLWGGNNYDRLLRIHHEHVEKILFSPDENYLLTWNGVTDKNILDSILLFNIRTGAVMHKFAYTGDGEWPIYKWSYDSKYLAILGKNCIGVYSLPSVTLLDGKVIGVPGIKDFEWSPAANIIAYWVPEANNKPAQINLINIPTKSILQSGSSTRVIDMNLHWHPQGTYLLAKITRTNKTKKMKIYSMQIYYMNIKDIPSEVVEIPGSVVDLAWEPHGNRLALILSKNVNTLSIYSMTKNTSKHCNLYYTAEKKVYNKIFWSPQGNYMVIANFESPQGDLDFFDCDEKLSYRQSSHFLCNGVKWDTSGRVVASVSSIPMFNKDKIEKSALENGYVLYTFQGKEIYRSLEKRFYQFIWRPRMKSLLTEEQRNNIIKNLKQYVEKYKQIDEKEQLEKAYNDAVKELKEIEEFRVFFLIYFLEI